MPLCIAERSVCGIRAVRLDAGCVPLLGPTDGAFAAAVATINLTADVQEGTKFEPVDGCGRVAYTAEDPDVVKRYNITMELVTLDFELLELLTDSTLLLGAAGTPMAGETIGIAEPGANTPNKNGVGLEIWTKTAFGTGACGDAETGNPNWIRHVLPLTKLRHGDRTFANEHANQSFSGTVNANPNYGDPWGDLPVEGGLDPNSPHQRFYDFDIPVESCGYIEPGALGS